jgi:EmrB/QacA subfamily drug resistance transporter
MTQPTTDAPSGTFVPAPRPDLPIILAGLVLSLILASLDQSIVNTALPRMASDLGGLAHLSWVITAFMLSSTIATPIFGKLSDMFGRRSFLLLAIALFVGASALCGLAQSMGQLIAFRFVQGIGAGGIMTLTQTIISDVVGPRERVRYQGLFSGTFALSAVAGPIIGGGLTTALSWRWVFYVNLPIGIVALAFILHALKPTEQRTTHAIDYLGAVLLAAVSSLALLLFSWGGSVFAWWSLRAGAVIAAVLILLALFLWRERRAAEPLLNLALFHIRRFTIGTITMGCMGFAMMSAMVFLPLYFQLVLGLNPAEAGFMLLPQILMMLVTSILGGKLSADLGRPKLFLAGGIALEAAGLTSLAILAYAGADIPWFWGGLAILGIGMGVAMPNATAIVQNAVPRDEMGVATASMSFIRSMGGALGVAVSGGVMTARLGSDLASHPGINAKAIIEGGMEVISSLPADVHPIIVTAFRDAIMASFEIGGGVMTFALLLALTLRGTDFAVAKPASNASSSE